jgi:hypothetical protein
MTVSLQLNPEEGTAKLTDHGGAHRPGQTDDPDEPKAPAEPLSYKLPKEIEWEMDVGLMPTYTFLPSGRADGPPLSFILRKRHFYIELDHLTGRMQVIQSDD